MSLLGFSLVTVLSSLPATSFLVTTGFTSTDGFVLLGSVELVSISQSTGIENVLILPFESEGLCDPSSE